MRQVELYTAITGGRDPKREDIRVFSAYERFCDPRLNAKIYKVLPHMFFEAEWSIWVDGHVRVNGSAEDLVKLAEGNDVAVFRHPWRNCIYEEAEECIRLELDDAETIREQVARYRREGYPANNGLAKCAVIIRRHTSRINQLCEQWWAEICRGSVRDQISFPYVFRRYFTISGEINSNPWFQPQGHLSKPPTVLDRATNGLRRVGRLTRRARERISLEWARF